VIEQFYSFHAIFFGIVKLFVLIAVGYGLSVSSVLKKEGADALSAVLIWALLPALILTRITSTFSPGEYPFWWILPLAAVILLCCCYLIALPFQRVFARSHLEREFITSSVFQNVGYLPMALTAFVCTGPFCDKILVFIFLFVMGFNLVFWSFGPVYLSKNSLNIKSLLKMINMPLIVTIFSIITIFIFGKGWMPKVIFEPLDILGKATFPMAMIVLGAYLGAYRGYRPSS